jgi:hypothetical protein
MFILSFHVLPLLLHPSTNPTAQEEHFCCTDYDNDMTHISCLLVVFGAPILALLDWL